MNLFRASLLVAAVALPALAFAQDPPEDLTHPPLPTTSEDADGRDPEEEEADEAPAPVKRPAARARPVEPKLGEFGLIGRGEEASVLARGELVVGQTAHGITQGVLVCVWVRCSSLQQGSGAVLLGGIAGGLGSFFLTHGGISGGPALAINNGASWGFAQGLLALQLFEPETGSTGYAGILSLTTLLGTAAGAGLGGLLHPTGGQVAMTTSGGIWSGALVALFLTPFLGNFSWEGFFALELTAVNVGLAGFGFLASRLDYSRGRMFLIDVGGIIGGLVGASAFLLAGLPTAQQAWMGPTAAVGAIAGLAGAVMLTSGIDGAASQGTPPELSLMPVGPEGSPGLSVGARF